MCFLMLTSGGIVERAELNSIDVLSIIWAAVCHDFKHDGFSNLYHVNSISDRAIRYSDLSVQENFHAAESFALLNQDQHNFIKAYSREDYITFRKRFIGMILATDMSRHVSDLSNFKSLIDNNDVKKGQNVS